MSLDLKYIATLNLQHKPFFSPKFEKEKWKNDIDSSLPFTSNLNNDNELVILCLEGLYGYRTGLLGYITTLLITNSPFKTYILKTIINSPKWC